jgi:hypothetical protein
MKNTKKKPITWVTDNKWSGTVEMLLGLDVDPYSYDSITDNLWSFKIRNRGKRTSTFSSRYLLSGSCVCGSIFKSFLPTPMTRSSDSIIITTNFTPSVNLL